MLKVILAVFLFAAYAQCSRLSDVLLDELIEKYEERRGADDLDPRFCGSTGLECERCSECHDHLQFGLCIKGATHARCLCKWGFTGKNAERVPNAGIDEWSVNRIRADDCKTHCHYTHDVWNEKCLATPKCDPDECQKKYGKCIDDVCVPTCMDKVCEAKCGKCVKGMCVHQCDPSNYEKCVNGKCIPICDKDKCRLSGGECREGKCKIRCCRNLLTSVPPYSGGPFKKYCYDRCEYVELKPGACSPVHLTPPCNPKCKQSGGICDKNTGRCKCCRDFTGPHAMYTPNGLTATHCGVWCPYRLPNGFKNMLCVNPDYVARAEKNQFNPVVSDGPPDEYLPGPNWWDY